MEGKKLYVVKFNNGLYWCGYNTADKQIRKANNQTTDGFKVDEVEIKKKEDI